MPLTKSQREIKGNFIREYGRKRGTNYFYGYERKHFPEKFEDKMKGGEYRMKKSIITKFGHPLGVHPHLNKFNTVGVKKEFEPKLHHSHLLLKSKLGRR